jgi:hypothetical protein
LIDPSLTGSDIPFTNNSPIKSDLDYSSEFSSFTKSKFSDISVK